MTAREAVIWLINITADIGKAEHRDLWHYEQALSEIREMLERLPSAQEEKWISEIREAYDRAKANPYIRKPLSRALYEVWHRYDVSEVERR